MATHGTIAAADYRPAWWLPGPHLMTMVPALARRVELPATRAERVELPDGDFVDLAWVGDGRVGVPRVLVLHGLEGSLASPYVRGILGAIDARGWRAVLMHFRGTSGEPNRLARAYHSGDTADVRHVLDVLAARGEHVDAAVGYSLGGNVLLKLLGEDRAASPLRAAVAVSAPLLLAPCADRLRRGASRVYDRWLLASLVARLREKERRLGLTPVPQARLTCIRDFDEHVTAPLHGFAGADDYYARSSSRPFLRHVARPTLILHALDDPFMTPEVVPAADELAPSVRLELAPRGGHVGFVEGGNPLRPRYWLDVRIPAFLAEALGAR